MGKIETIPFNSSLSDKTISIDTSDITSLCPLTGLRDYGHLSIQYTPSNSLLELKSLKLYLNSFDNEDVWQEDFLSRIEADIVSAISPKFLKISLTYNTRGGMDTKVESSYWASLSKPKLKSEDELWKLPVGILTIQGHSTPVNFVLSTMQTEKTKILHFIVDGRSKKAKLVSSTKDCSLVIHDEGNSWKDTSALIAKGKITKTDPGFSEYVYSTFSSKYPGYIDEMTEVCGQEEMDKDIILTMVVESIKYFTSEDITKEGGA